MKSLQQFFESSSLACYFPKIALVHSDIFSDHPKKCISIHPGEL